MIVNLRVSLVIKESGIFFAGEGQKGIALGSFGSFIRKTHVCPCTHSDDCVYLHTYLFIQQALSETFPYVRSWGEVDIVPAFSEFTF